MVFWPPSRPAVASSPSSTFLSATSKNQDWLPQARIWRRAEHPIPMDLGLQHRHYHQNDGQGQKETRTCYHYGKSGHLAKNCWQQLGQGPQRQHGKSAFMGIYEQREYQPYGYTGVIPPHPLLQVGGNIGQSIDTAPKK